MGFIKEVVEKNSAYKNIFPVHALRLNCVADAKYHAAFIQWEFVNEVLTELYLMTNLCNAFLSMEHKSLQMN